MDTYLETIFTAVSWNWGEVFSTEILSNLQTEKNDHVVEFWWGVISVCSFINCRVTGWLQSHMKMAGRRFIRIRKKLVEVVQLDNITVNWKFLGGGYSRIITDSRYKPGEFVQIKNIVNVCYWTTFKVPTKLRNK